MVFTRTKTNQKFCYEDSFVIKSTACACAKMTWHKPVTSSAIDFVIHVMLYKTLADD